MRYSELPDKYKKLVLLRNFQENKRINIRWSIKDSIENCESGGYIPSLFDWRETKEGNKFWDEVSAFKLRSSLPIISEESEDEIRSFFLEEKVNPVNSIDSPVLKEFLISKAKEKYPIGTVVSNSNLFISSTGSNFTIENYSSFFIRDQEVWYKDKNNGNWTLSYRGKWADVVETANVAPKKDSAGHFPSSYSDREFSMGIVNNPYYAEQANLEIERIKKEQEYQKEYQKECQRIVSSPLLGIYMSKPILTSGKRSSNTTQPIVEDRVKTKSKSKRLIYKHY